MFKAILAVAFASLAFGASAQTTVHKEVTVHKDHQEMRHDAPVVHKEVTVQRDARHDNMRHDVPVMRHDNGMHRGQVRRHCHVTKKAVFRNGNRRVVTKTQCHSARH